MADDVLVETTAAEPLSSQGSYDQYIAPTAEEWSQRVPLTPLNGDLSDTSDDGQPPPFHLRANSPAGSPQVVSSSYDVELPPRPNQLKKTVQREKICFAPQELGAAALLEEKEEPKIGPRKRKQVRETLMKIGVAEAVLASVRRDKQEAMEKRVAGGKRNYELMLQSRSKGMEGLDRHTPASAALPAVQRGLQRLGAMGPLGRSIGQLERQQRNEDNGGRGLVYRRASHPYERDAQRMTVKFGLIGRETKHQKVRKRTNAVEMGKRKQRGLAAINVSTVVENKHVDATEQDVEGGTIASGSARVTEEGGVANERGQQRVLHHTSSDMGRRVLVQDCDGRIVSVHASYTQAAQLNAEARASGGLHFRQVVDAAAPTRGPTDRQSSAYGRVGLVRNYRERCGA